MKKNTLSNMILILVLIIGLSLLLYPTVSELWNERHQTRAIASYSQQIAAMDDESYQSYWEEAWEYNRSLLQRENNYLLNEEQKALYYDQLDFHENGIMGYIEIPSIDTTLAIYHGTDDTVLQVAVGHLDWTSLPVGGESTHCVVSGHRGLPSARLFTDLDRLAVGDIFMLHVLDETLTYEVDQIRIVEPHETDELLIQEGRDLCTLVTCTPYGVNSHRMLVRGHRVDNLEEAQVVRVTADAVIVEKLIVAPFVLVPILLLLIIWLILPKRKKK